MIRVYVITYILMVFANYSFSQDTNIYDICYNPSRSKLNPKFTVYHDIDSSAIIMFSQSLAEIERFNKENVFKYSVKYLLKLGDNDVVVDSATHFYSINRDHVGEEFNSFFRIKVPDKLDYFLIIIFECRDTKTKKQVVYQFNNSNALSNKDFFIESILKDKSVPVFGSFVASHNKYRIKSERIDNDSIKCYYYQFNYNMPSPAYNIHPDNRKTVIEPDTVFTYFYGDTIIFSKEGSYFFSSDENDYNGLVLINTGSFYHKVKTLKAMIKPLYYLTGTREFSNLSESENMKLAIDEFWFKRSNNIRSAREQIRVYYNRVQLSNYYFSDYRPGFATDRGMIYILLGAPSGVRRGFNEEFWYYGVSPEKAQISFLFLKQKSQFGVNEWILERGQQYQIIWGQIISTWRDGRVFIINN